MKMDAGLRVRVYYSPLLPMTRKRPVYGLLDSDYPAPNLGVSIVGLNNLE